MLNTMIKKMNRLDTDMLECWCVWMHGLASPWDQSAVRWHCPSCTGHRWCCTDTGGPACGWTHRSWTWTSYTLDQSLSVGSHRCPVHNPAGM